MDPSRSRWLLPGLSNASLLRFLLVFACGWASLQLLNFFSLPISLFLVAGVLAVLLDTPVRWVSRLMPRPLAIALTTLTALGLVVAFVTGLGQQLAGQGQALLAELEAGLRQIPLPISPGQRELDLDQALQLLGKLSHGLDLLGGAFSKLMAFVVVLVLTVYMLADGGRLLRSLLNRLPQPFGLQLQGALERSVLGFLRGQLSLVAFLSVASALLFQALGVQFALMLAVVVGVLDAIPGIGATLGVAVVAVVVVLTQGPWLALRVVIGSVLLQQVQDNLLHPRVMGRALSLPPLVLFFSLFVGERIAGLLGVFLAIPVAGVIVNWPREPALPEQC
ncbi:MAG: AI-2E family transporter [Synechococcaceae cyanobacterium]|jgi:predicted PurR-regulated permease PerM